MIDIGRAFKAPFEDSEWISKTLLGFLWGLLVVTAPAVAGAQLEYIRGVSSGDERLPSWDNFGNKWVEGFLVFVAGMLYFLPVVVLGFIFVVPALIGALAAGSDTSSLAGGLIAGGLCLYLPIALIYSVAVSVLFSAALTNYAMRRSFGAFFEFSAIMALVRGGTGYFTAWLYTVLIAFVGSIVSGILSSSGFGAILSPLVTFLVTMMSGHVLGQWAARAFIAQQTIVQPSPQDYYAQPPAPTPPQ